MSSFRFDSLCFMVGNTLYAASQSSYRGPRLCEASSGSSAGFGSVFDKPIHEVLAEMHRRCAGDGSKVYC